MTTTSLCNFFFSYRPQIMSKCGEENMQQSFQHSDLIIIQYNNIYPFVLCKYQSRESNFHLRITLTQQNPKILVHIPIQKILKTMTNN